MKKKKSKYMKKFTFVLFGAFDLFVANQKPV